MLLFLFLFSKAIFSKKILQAIDLTAEYENLGIQGTTGKYDNNEYVQSHTIPVTYFSIYSSGGTKNSHPISNLFDKIGSSYWVSQDPNTESFHNALYINFTAKINFEAFLYDTAYSTNGNTRRYDGFPRILKVYTSINEEPYKLKAIFEGYPAYPMSRIQFVFNEPIICDKIILEFYDVTPNMFFTDGNTNPCCGNLFILGDIQAERATLSSPTGYYANNEYISLNKITSDQFNATSTGGSNNNRPLSNLFDGNDRNYWVSRDPNSDNFRNSIIIDFNQTKSLNVILFDTAYSTNHAAQTRRFDGFPTTLNVYTAMKGKPFILHTVFTGNPVYPMTRVMFKLSNAVKCDSIKLEFYETTPDYSFSSGALNCVLAEITLLKAGPYTMFIGGTSGVYSNNNYVQSHLLKSSCFTATSLGNEKASHPLSNAFDSQSSTYFVTRIKNTDTFKNALIIDFIFSVTLEAILYDTAYSTSSQTRRFDGFPTTFNIYASSDEGGEFNHIVSFVGNPVWPMTRIQFVFVEPITCRKLKLEFAELTPDNFFSGGEKQAVSGGIYFILNHKTGPFKPLFLVPSFNDSPIYSTVKSPDLYPECPSNISNLLLTSPASTNSQLLSQYPECVAKLLRIQFNKETGQIEQLPGISTFSSSIGSVSDFSSLFKLSSKAITIGYSDNTNIFAVGYNYMFHPFGSSSVYANLKTKIESVFTSTNQKVVLIGHGQGASFISIFISNYSDSQWVKQYIDNVIFVAPAFAGSGSFMKYFNQDVPPFEDCEELTTSIMRMPGMQIMLPNYAVFGDRPIIYNFNHDFDQLNAEHWIELMKYYERIDDDSEVIFKNSVEKYLKVPIPEPPVPSFIIYNDNIETSNAHVVYKHQFKVDTKIEKHGDGEVSAEGAEYACSHWKTAKCHNVHDSTIHSEMLSKVSIIEEIIDYIMLGEASTKEEPKTALFFASDFDRSSLYATVTDAEKVPMCPSTLKEFQFYSNTNQEQWKIIDDTNKKYWLTDECVAMLTRVELSEDEKSINIQPGVKLSTSKFDELKLNDFYHIVKKALDNGYTLYKNIFGISYNFLHFPLLSDEYFETLKVQIEEYFSQTGMKSIVAGHGLGANFIETFITEYVTEDWANKYISGCIFYAPSFGGTGVYERLVNGKYGNSLDGTSIEIEKSVQRLSSLHVLLPNEEVFSDKVVIKNFPNEGDQSNATFISSLLKQLGRMDETSEKIFHMTDNYRKSSIKEPPVPSLVIYNDQIDTENGYIYNSQNNTVTSFYGKGDGSVSSDGPSYVCDRWNNAWCANIKRSDVFHDNVQSDPISVKETFKFIEKVKSSPVATPTPFATPSLAVSQTPVPSPSQSPTKTPQVPSQTQAPPPPSLPPDFSGEVILDSNNCSLEHRCEAVVPGENYVLVNVKVTEFNNFWNPGHGGAIHMINTGLICTDSVFNECSSSGGGGGGIFIVNDLQIDNKINLTNIQFNRCSAVFGGAIYVFSSYVPTSITKCTFMYSFLMQPDEGTDGAFYDGSAIFLTVMSGFFADNDVIECESTAIKLYNNFDIKPIEWTSKRSSVLLSTKSSSFTLQNCRFRNGLKSKAAVFYWSEIERTPFEIKDCSFSGSLKEGSHYIEGKTASKKASKLRVVSCKFATDSNKAFKLNQNNGFLEVDLKNQVFQNDTFLGAKNELFNEVWIISAAIVVIIVIAFQFGNKKKNDQKEN